MAAYAVTARIGRVDPHLAIRGVGRSRLDAHRPERAPTDDGPVIPAAVVVDPLAGDTVGEQFLRFRERWAQLTFFLFDPDSWRT
jgi:hypothetical protein